MSTILIAGEYSRSVDPHHSWMRGLVLPDGEYRIT
jgi:hypothetical protein